MLLLFTFILLFLSPRLFTCTLQMRSVILLIIVINEYDADDDGQLTTYYAFLYQYCVHTWYILNTLVYKINVSKYVNAIDIIFGIYTPFSACWFWATNSRELCGRGAAGARNCC